MPSRTLILNAQHIQQRIDRIAYQIYESNYQEKEISVAGIVSNGYTLAERIAEKLSEISSLKISLLQIKLNKKQPLSDKVHVLLSNGKQIQEKT